VPERWADVKAGFVHRGARRLHHETAGHRAATECVGRRRGFARL